MELLLHQHSQYVPIEGMLNLEYFKVEKITVLVKFISRFKVVPQASLKVNLSWYLENTFERNELADIQDTFTQEYLENPAVVYGRSNGRCYTYFKNARVNFASLINNC